MQAEEGPVQPMLGYFVCFATGDALTLFGRPLTLGPLAVVLAVVFALELAGVLEIF